MLITPASQLVDALGAKAAKELATLQLRTVGDLLRHYPRRYEQRRALTPLASLRVDEQVTVLAQVRAVRTRRMTSRPGTITEVIVTDGTGELRLTFFKQAWRQGALAVGCHGLFAGKVRMYKGARELAHPDLALLDNIPAREEGKAELMVEPLVPIYASTTKLASWNVAKAVRIALDLVEFPDDIVPAAVRERHGLLDQRGAFEAIHHPGSFAEVDAARTRFKWEEALGLQLVLAQRRARARAQPTTPRPVRPDGLLADFERQLPYVLTGGQHAVSDEIFGDLAAAVPMHRLLQGEVGSGKTVVAVRAMLAVVDAGGQAALLAPTEVLAGQHLRSIRDLLGPLALAGELGSAEHATRVALLTGSQGSVARRSALAEAASGTAGIIIGTHALLSEDVAFADLGLVVVDEQHRFGVEQRDALRAKGARPPHLLVMTATPIPRTVAMTVYGDLETSVLRELPAGRRPIQTTVVPLADKPAWLDRVWAR
ncbi:MAG TPA: DEAD/DEAH box helicase, partial [Mycobacteriales bacterium]|nr:DEAD/DEAH box helicase [Mycobacteriales bacterium]